MSLDLSSLNAAQKEAAIATEGPCLIIAGPGSGKTLVLTCRIAYLLEKNNVPPHQILVLTFTNRAAQEMKDRIQKIISHSIRYLWIGTFHSIFARILRKEAPRLGFTSDFSIYDQGDATRLIKRIIQELKLSDRYSAKEALHYISIIKRYATNPTSSLTLENLAAQKPFVDTIYNHYQARCKGSNAMDFDDLLLFTHQLFQENPSILAKYQTAFRYILVDEFQDTDTTQYNILKKLAAQHRNICVIGDDAQSIYRFRGANIANILFFQKAFPDTRIVKLEQNYRSTKTIVKAANMLIKHNRQYTKVLFTNNETGDLIRIVPMLNDLDESIFIAHSIQKHAKQGIKYNDIAILYRTNKQSRVLEEALIRKNIPYQILGSFSFYQRQEIKDFLAYLHLIVNPNNEEALRRTINQPKRGIGTATLGKIQQHAERQGMAIWDAVLNIQDCMQGKVANKIEAFASLIEEHRNKLLMEDAYTIAKSILHASGLLALLSKDKTEQGINRYENLQEMVESIRLFCEDSAQKATLAHFLEEIALLTDKAAQEAERQQKVSLMTIHKSKGLEFAHLYIAGMQEDVFPGEAAYHAKKLEEERRLFFVAITRAKKQLTITYPEHLYNYKKKQIVASTPSRFLKELDPSSTQFYQRTDNLLSKV